MVRMIFFPFHSEISCGKVVFRRYFTEKYMKFHWKIVDEKWWKLNANMKKNRIFDGFDLESLWLDHFRMNLCLWKCTWVHHSGKWKKSVFHHFQGATTFSTHYGARFKFGPSNAAGWKLIHEKNNFEKYRGEESVESDLREK